ncbi:MAG TPA: hypothetical protein VIZ17_12955 [Acetobacteraceae bacterium]
MSSSSISNNQSAWYWQNQAAQGTAQGSGVANSGTSAAADSFSSFAQAFASALQSLAAQSGTANTASTSQTATNQPTTGTRHHHHDRGENSDGDQTGSMQVASSSQMAGSIGQVLQGGSLVAGGIASSASTLAGQVMQAMASYGSAATPAGAALAILT